MSDTPLITPPTTRIGPFDVGRLAFGCWRLVDMSPEDAALRIHAAIDAGMTLIDTADVYGLDWGGSGFGAAEALLGQVLAAEPGLRNRMVLASKGGIMPGVPYDSNPEYLRSACEASLSRLGVDTIDLYQIHRPDIYTHPASVAETLSALRDEGKIREVGVSNHTVAQTEALIEHLPFPLASTQPQFSAAHLAPLIDGTLDLALRRGVAVMAWSPLHGGALATGAADAVPEDLIATLDRLADREGCDRATIAMAWVLAHPSKPIAITGSQTLDRIAAAPAAFEVALDRADVYAIVEASQGVPLP